MYKERYDKFKGNICFVFIVKIFEWKFFILVNIIEVLI